MYYKPTKKSLITSVSLETEPEEYKYTFVHPALANKEIYKPIKKLRAPLYYLPLVWIPKISGTGCQRVLRVFASKTFLNM